MHSSPIHLPNWWPSKPPLTTSSTPSALPKGLKHKNDQTLTEHQRPLQLRTDMEHHKLLLLKSKTDMELHKHLFKNRMVCLRLLHNPDLFQCHCICQLTHRPLSSLLDHSLDMDRQNHPTDPDNHHHRHQGLPTARLTGHPHPRDQLLLHQGQQQGDHLHHHSRLGGPLLPHQRPSHSTSRLQSPSPNTSQGQHHQSHNTSPDQLLK